MGWWGSFCLDCFEFKFEQRLSGVHPSTDFNEHVCQSEPGDSRLQTCQHGHDDTASFRTRSCFARAGSLANLGFAPSISFAAIVRRFDFGMLNKHEQAFDIVGQLPLLAERLQSYR